MTNTLSPFQPDATCPKCGGTDLSIQWRREQDRDWIPREERERFGDYADTEIMSYCCRRCGYGWFTAPLDAIAADDRGESEFRTGALLSQIGEGLPAEPSIPVSRVVGVLAERYLSMHDGAQVRVGVDRANYHIRSLEDAWVSAAFGVDHEFDAAIRAELARRKGAA